MNNDIKPKRVKCSRCLKVCWPLFEYEHLSPNHGRRIIEFCPSCTKWALLWLLTQPSTKSENQEALFRQSEDIRAFLESKQLTTRIAKKGTTINEDRK